MVKFVSLGTALGGTTIAAPLRLPLFTARLPPAAPIS
jgi:hypothetical protein